MRIVLSCLQSLRRHHVPAYDFWRPHFVNGCEEAGIEYLEVADVDWAEGLVHGVGPELNAWKARTWDRVMTFVRKEHARHPIDAFLGYLYPRLVDTGCIDDIQRLGIPCVNFFCDNVREFVEVPRAYRPFALHWVPEYEALPMYRKAGLAHLHAPMPCWVPPALRTVPAVETEPSCFIGSADVLRRDLLGRALDHGADFVVMGPGWLPDSPTAASAAPTRFDARRALVNQWTMLRERGARSLAIKLVNRMAPVIPPVVPAGRIRPIPSNAEYVRITREARITIGINRVPTTRAWDRAPIAYSRLRDLEAPMVGACYLTEWSAGVGELYELGAEVETYRTAEELAHKLRELAGNPERRRGLRTAGQRRALADHTVARTLRRIVQWVTGRRAA